MPSGSTREASRSEDSPGFKMRVLGSCSRVAMPCLISHPPRLYWLAFLYLRLFFGLPCQQWALHVQASASK